MLAEFEDLLIKIYIVKDNLVIMLIENYFAVIFR